MATAPKKQRRSSVVAKRLKRGRAVQAPTALAEAPRQTLLAGPRVSDLDDLDDALAAMDRAATEEPRRTALVRKRA